MFYMDVCFVLTSSFERFLISSLMLQAMHAGRPKYKNKPQQKQHVSLLRLNPSNPAVFPKSNVQVIHSLISTLHPSANRNEIHIIRVARIKYQNI